MADTPVVFVHGLWLHADSWGNWVDLFREAGYTSDEDLARIVEIVKKQHVSAEVRVQRQEREAVRDGERGEHEVGAAPAPVRGGPISAQARRCRRASLRGADLRQRRGSVSRPRRPRRSVDTVDRRPADSETP